MKVAKEAVASSDAIRDFIGLFWPDPDPNAE
jgi:hypothetical protein